jgi:hypothetical protein
VVAPGPAAGGMGGEPARGRSSCWVSELRRDVFVSADTNELYLGRRLPVNAQGASRWQSLSRWRGVCDEPPSRRAAPIPGRAVMTSLQAVASPRLFVGPQSLVALLSACVRASVSRWLPSLCPPGPLATLAGMMLIFRNPTLPGYPRQISSLDVAINVQDTSVDLNATAEAQLLLFNAIEYEDVAPPGGLTALNIDAYIGGWPLPLHLQHPAHVSILHHDVPVVAVALA